MFENFKNILNKSQAEQFLKNEIPNSLWKITNALTSENFDIFLVGGSVRDSFISKTPKDFDLATNALPDEVMKSLDKHNIKSTPRGVEFGVVVANVDNEEFEIATFREDVSGGTGNLMDDKVELGVSIETDVKRRDLTINALFFNLKTNEIVDLVGGIDDMKNNVINTVGDPKERFKEDSTRKLRSIRFSAQMDFNISNEIKNEIKKDPLLKCNNERIMLELDKIFDPNRNKDMMKSALLMEELGLIEQIFKGCKTKKIETDVISLTTFIANVLVEDRDNLGDAFDIFLSVDIQRAVLSLWMLSDLDNNEPIDIIRTMNGVKLSGEEIKSFTNDNRALRFLDREGIQKSIKKFNLEAIEYGLKGKDIGDYTKDKIRELMLK